MHGSLFPPGFHANPIQIQRRTCYFLTITSLYIDPTILSLYIYILQLRIYVLQKKSELRVCHTNCEKSELQVYSTHKKSNGVIVQI